MWSSGAVVSLAALGARKRNTQTAKQRANLLCFKEQEQHSSPPLAANLPPRRPFAPERVHFWAQLARFAENFGGHLRFR